MTDHSSLLEKLSFNAYTLKDMCPSIFSSGEVQTAGIAQSSLDVEFTENDDDRLLQQKKYYDKVEEGNRYIKELKEIEKEYFENKYGTKIYQYILEEREKYENKNLFGNSTGTNIENELTTYYDIYNDVSGVDQLNEIKMNLDALEEDVRTMVNETESNKRKMEYRHEVSEQVLSQSTKITYIYYFIVSCIFVFLISKNALRIQEHILLYSFVLVFPFLYRYVFIGLVYVYNLLIQTMSVRGPKNAFLDNAVDLQFLDDYDI